MVCCFETTLLIGDSRSQSRLMLISDIRAIRSCNDLLDVIVDEYRCPRVLLMLWQGEEDGLAFQELPLGLVARSPFVTSDVTSRP